MDKSLKSKLTKIYSVDVIKANERSSDSIALTYGEITWKGVNQFIDYLPRKINKDDVFLDIGSGRGKMVLHMALHTPVQKSIGVELFEARHEDAIQLKKEIGDIPGKEALFINKDIFETDVIQQATIIFANTLTWDYESVKKLVDLTTPGTVFITNKVLYNEAPITVLGEKIQLSVSWNEQKGCAYYLIEKTEKTKVGNEYRNIVKNSVDTLLENIPGLMDKVTDVVANLISQGKVEFKSNDEMNEFINKLILKFGKDIVLKIKKEQDGG